MLVQGSKSVGFYLFISIKMFVNEQNVTIVIFLILIYCHYSIIIFNEYATEAYKFYFLYVIK